MEDIRKIHKKLPIRQIFFFGVSGFIGYVVDAGITVLLEPILGVYIARIPAFISAVTTTWIVNRNITFRTQSSRHESLLSEYVHYILLMTSGLLVNYVVYAISISLLKEFNYAVLICVGLGSLAGMMVNFVVSKKYVYNQPRV